MYCKSASCTCRPRLPPFCLKDKGVFSNRELENCMDKGEMLTVQIVDPIGISVFSLQLQFLEKGVVINNIISKSEPYAYTLKGI